MEPNNESERLLKAHAEKRRGEAGAFDFGLAPAARRRLHAEVARVYDKAPGEASLPALLRRFWPRLAIGIGAASLVLTFAILLSPGRHQPAEMASMKLEEENYAAVPAEKLDERRDAASDEGIKDNLPIEAATRRAPEPSQPIVAGQSRSVAPLQQPAGPADVRRQMEGARSPATAPARAMRQEMPAPASPERESVADAGGVGTFTGRDVDQQTLLARLDADSTRLNFVRQPGSAGADSVLSAFAIELNGDRVRLTDADGSVYEGTIVTNRPAAPAARPVPAESPPAAATPATARARSPSESAPLARRENESLPESAAVSFGGSMDALIGTSSESMPPGSWSFEVAGTNRVMNQAVRLRAAVLPASAGSEGQRLSGSLRVGAGEEIRVQAVTRP